MQNRVDEIRKLISPESWSHCRGKENLPSRGLSVATNHLWRYGPGWLVMPIISPVETPEPEIPKSCFAELKASSMVGAHSLLIPQLPCRLSNVIDVKRFSSAIKLLLRLNEGG